MSTLYCFNVKMNFPIFFSNGSIFTICQWTSCAIAQATHAVGMPTKHGLVGFGLANGSFVRTKLVINHLPYHFIILHDDILQVSCTHTHTERERSMETVLKFLVLAAEEWKKNERVSLVVTLFYYVINGIFVYTRRLKVKDSFSDNRQTPQKNNEQAEARVEQPPLARTISLETVLVVTRGLNLHHHVEPYHFTHQGCNGTVWWGRCEVRGTGCRVSTKRTYNPTCWRSFATRPYFPRVFSTFTVCLWVSVCPHCLCVFVFSFSV